MKEDANNGKNRNDGSRAMATRPPEVVANLALCLIHQADYLIDQQLQRLEKDFLEQGGLRERMTRLRLQRRNKPPPR
jgi:four helix bundle suffix protein